MPIPVSPWTARVWQEYRAGNLTRAYRDVLLTLRTFRGHGGHCWPSHATLADRAECCTRTVQRALTQAQRPGASGLGRAPRPGGVALVAIIQLVPVRHASRTCAGRNAADFHYRTEGPGRGKSKETRGIERNASVGRGAARPVSGAPIDR